MHKYVFDTNIWVILYMYFKRRKTFGGLWKKIDQLIKNGDIVSPFEVRRELEKFHKGISSNIKKIRRVFLKPTLEEMILVKEIVNKYPEIMKKKNINKGTPIADPFLIAMAKHLKSTLVTNEIYKEHAIKIPNVCRIYKIKCIDLDGFFGKEKMEFPA